ncbi:zinc finger protein 282-like isoform X2 [Podarcis raffonei]|uniref:zinc finger protein 282-like isoform X2 n=1 Tax=Podarcis raffonei TaxID=65483 RepID=UPI002329742F|nr:zinc finger protein 282-like isoform X2 [Podarcis raffonei]
MAGGAPVQAMECDAEPRSLLPFQSLVNLKQATTRDMQVQTSEASMWAAVAAIQAIDKTVDNHTMRLLRLEGRMGSAEKKLGACQKTSTEMENQLESKWAALGTLTEEYRQLQKRLENVENLLKNRNFWILRFPPGVKGETPKVPVTFNDLSVHFNEKEWGDLDELQKELYKTVMKSNYEMLVSLDYAVAKPEILTRIEQGEELCEKGLGDSEGSGVPEQLDADCPTAPVDVSLWLKQEVEESQNGEAKLPEETSNGYHMGSPMDIVESSSWIKEEVEEVCFAPEDGQERDLGHKGSLEYQTVTVDEEHMAEPQEGMCVQEPLFLGEGPSTAEQETSAETQEDGSRRKPDLLIDLSGRTTPPSPGHSLACGAEPGAQPQPTKEEPENFMQELYSYLECGKRFGNERSLLDHETPHPFQCLECHKSFGWEDERQPDSHPPATCPECTQRLRKKRSSLAHVADAQPFACATCGATFSQWSMQLLHQKCHVPHSHSCGDCGAGAGSAQELQRHRRAHAVVGRAHSCLNCPCSFLSSSELAAHRRTHTSSWPFTCSWCQSTFASRKVLSEHQELHVAAARKVLPHVKLSFSFNWREFLAEQMKHCLHSSCSPRQALTELLQKNSELWPYPCAECGTHFFNQWALANHRCAPSPKVVAGGGSVLWQGAGADLPPAAFQCPSCGLGFPQEELLAQHLPRHSGEGRPFQCPHCKNSYLCKEALAGHVQSHFTWRPAHCYICDRDFAQPEELVEHLSTHVVEHPYKCGRCHKSFLSPFLLGKHFQQEHAALG